MGLQYLTISKLLRYSTPLIAWSSLFLCGCEGNPKVHEVADSNFPDEICALPSFSWLEGGIVSFEYIQYSTGLQATFPPRVLRNISFFTSAGGDDHVFLTPGTGDGTSGLNECNHVSSDDITWPVNDVSVQTHVDVGALTISGGPMDLVVSPRSSGTAREMTDVIGRLHSGAWYQTIKASEMPAPDNISVDSFVAPDNYYSVALEGSADYPPTTYEDLVYMPSAMVMTNPTGDFAINRPTNGFTEPLVVTWESGESANQPENNWVLSFVMLTNGSGTKIIEYCATLDDGQFVVPPEVLDEYYADEPTGGMLQVCNVSHNFTRFDDGRFDGDFCDNSDYRRIDFLGMWCEAMAFTINSL